MRLLIDLQGLQNNSRQRGIGRYVKELLGGILRNSRGHDLRFLLNAVFADHVDEVIQACAGLAAPEQFIIMQMPAQTSALDPDNAWRRAAARIIYKKIVRDLNPDALLIGSLFEGGNDNTTVTVDELADNYVVSAILYDLIPLLNQDEHIGSQAARTWYFDCLEQARKCNLLLGISQSACGEAIDHLPSDLDVVRHVGAAAGKGFEDFDRTAPGVAEQMRNLQSYYEISKPYLMNTSALDPRKNFEGLIAAFARLPEAVRSAHQLVLVCKLDPPARARLTRLIDSLGLADGDVVLTGFVPDPELRLLYAGCKLFVFPSFHEGFGLPVVEAMWCGAPAIGSCVSSVPEVIGLTEALFDPNDIDAMSRLIDRSLSDTAFRARLLDHAHKHARTFSWDMVAQRVLDAIEQAVSKHSPPLQSARSTSETIEVIAQLPHWRTPSDADLLAVATALAKSEEVSWPKTDDTVSGIHNQVLLC